MILYLARIKIMKIDKRNGYGKELKLQSFTYLYIYLSKTATFSLTLIIISKQFVVQSLLP